MFTRERLLALTKYVLGEFGPLIAFWLLLAVSDIKAAILGSIVAILADAAWRRYEGRAFTRLYLLVSGLTLVFGAVDLCVATPFMLKFEAPITNLATGTAFVIGAFGTKPILQELAEERQNERFPVTPEVRRFFQLFTLFWAGYFFVKAAFYVWIATLLPLAEALALRSLVGGVSLGLMTAFSVTQGRRMFFVLRRLRLLPAPQ